MWESLFLRGCCRLLSDSFSVSRRNFFFNGRRCHNFFTNNISSALGSLSRFSSFLCLDWSSSSFLGCSSNIWWFLVNNRLRSSLGWCSNSSSCRSSNLTSLNILLLRLSLLLYLFNYSFHWGFQDCLFLKFLSLTLLWASGRYYISRSFTLLFLFLLCHRLIFNMLLCSSSFRNRDRFDLRGGGRQPEVEDFLCELREILVLLGVRGKHDHVLGARTYHHHWHLFKHLGMYCVGEKLVIIISRT